MPAETIRDPMARCAHSEIHSLETVCQDLRRMRLDDVEILQRGYDEGARKRVDTLTDILRDIDRIELDRVLFIHERQKICKDCKLK